MQSCSANLRACLHGGGGPQVGEVTRLRGVKKKKKKWNNPPLYAILQPRHAGVHFLKIYWMVAKDLNKKNAGKPRVLAINALLHSLAALVETFSDVALYCYL